MITCFVCWSGDPDRCWRPAPFVTRIEKLGDTAYLTLDATTFPEKHWSALVKCCLFRWQFGGEWIMARVGHVHQTRNMALISVTAKVMEG